MHVTSYVTMQTAIAYTSKSRLYSVEDHLFSVAHWICTLKAVYRAAAYGTYVGPRSNIASVSVSPELGDVVCVNLIEL
jgi:hypothetical protein